MAAATASELQSSPIQPNAKSDKLTRVADPSLVCMVNDQYMGRPQIPVAVRGSVYYGCCEMCKGRLANDPTTRAGVDPVSGRAVDKSVAVIGRAADGSTLYFENNTNFLAYSSK